MVEGRDHTSGDSFIKIGVDEKRGEDMYVSRDGEPAEAPDLDLIAAARNYLPELIAEVRRLRCKMSNPDQSELHQATHPDPVWRDRADFLIRAPLGNEHHLKSEQLWARQLGDLAFEICCVPFHVYDRSLGDVVRTNEDYDIAELLKPSGRYTFRFWLRDQLADPDEITASLRRLGSAFEWSGPDLLAIDAADETAAQRVADYLHDEQQAGRLVYETGKT